MAGLAATGARAGVLSSFRRFVAQAMARDLQVFVLPGPDVARAYGLDFTKTDMRLAATPRHASVLLIVGALPEGLRNAASIVYAQMPRPRAILALQAGDLTPLPVADVKAELSQSGLHAGLAELRQSFATGAFRAEITDFSAQALETRIQYTCPMHPEVISDEPGSCPKCGMDLVAREASAGIGHAGHIPDESEVPMSNPKTPAQPHSAHDHDKHAGAEAAQYTCPMHPEVVSDEPGSCPKCGMFLVPVEQKSDGDHSGHDHHTHDKQASAETAQYTCPMHPEVVSDEPGSCPKCGMFLVPVEQKSDGDHSGHDHHTHDKHASAEAAQYTCPMHPEVISDEPGSCPKCGMFLVPVEQKDDKDHSGHDHSGHAGQGGHAGHAMTEAVEGIEPQFMSMVDLTKGQPRSSDGLQMEWIEVPFGPFFPGLPGGLELGFTLDGDTVVSAAAHSAVGSDAALVSAPLTPDDFLALVTKRMPLSPISYRLLAVATLEKTAGLTVSDATNRGRTAALERERIASHLSWLAAFGLQAGFGWLASRAASLQLEVQKADAKGIAQLAPAITALLRRVRRARFLRARLSGVGQLDARADVAGPIARSLGQDEDARSDDETYVALGFTPVLQADGDALARLAQLCDEMAQSLEIIAAAGVLTLPEPVEIDAAASGEGEVIIETPRGAARLWLSLEAGYVTEAKLTTPSTRHLALIQDLTAQQELGDALVAVASLDISPWEIIGDTPRDVRV